MTPEYLLMQASECEWDESDWFNQWLEMARRQQTGDGSSDSDQQGNNSDADSRECSEFAPPFGEWNLSLRDSNILSFPLVASLCVRSAFPRRGVNHLRA